jgi:predicted aspartyl protease
VRRVFTLVLGIVIGQWLAFGAAVSPAHYHARAERAWRGHDYVEALQLWSQAVALQPADPNAHYRRGTALAQLGLRISALDAFQIALLLEPSPPLARQVAADIARLTQGAEPAGAHETTVPLEHGLGVWTAQVRLNDRQAGRFLVDTGSSVTVVAPRLAAEVGLAGTAGRPPVELQTLGGRAAGRAAVAASLRVGDLELHDVPVVLHDPGPGFDGILGNTVLARYRVTLDGDRRQLHLRLLARD